jgi:branched-chain amino acid transport system substrate-binding protein
MTEEIRQLRPEGIYLIAYIPDLVALLERLRVAGVTTLLMGTGAVTEQLPRLAGAAAEHLVYPQQSFDAHSTEPAVAGFVAAYEARYGEAPGVFAAHGYDALKLVWQAMRDTGEAQPDDIRRGLMALDDYAGAAGRISFDDRGDVVRYPRRFVIHDGRPIPYEQFEQEGGELPVPEQG